MGEEAVPVTRTEGRCSETSLLDPRVLEGMRRFTSPTIANALEILGVPLQAVCTNSSVRCLFPDLGPLVAYACTAVIHSAKPACIPRAVRRTDYWEYTRDFRRPCVTVVQDLSEQPGGAYWGEINANIHRTLGSLGIITNGTVRDLEEVRKLGFHCFCSGTQVSHGFAHLEDFNVPVKLFDIVVHPGDLIHADRHGAVIIPPDVAEEVIGAAAEIERGEKEMIELCNSADFSIRKLDKLISPSY
jgi:4-hydroxy-4-methyl-2-oxoglutarate aldolase